jgi:hypothetical protein
VEEVLPYPKVRLPTILTQAEAVRLIDSGSNPWRHADDGLFNRYAES